MRQRPPAPQMRAAALLVAAAVAAAGACVVTNENIDEAATCIDANTVTLCNVTLQATGCTDATNWNTSGVTTMASAFLNKDLRLQDISDWDMGAVTPWICI